MKKNILFILIAMVCSMIHLSCKKKSVTPDDEENKTEKNPKYFVYFKSGNDSIKYSDLDSFQCGVSHTTSSGAPYNTVYKVTFQKPIWNINDLDKNAIDMTLKGYHTNNQPSALEFQGAFVEGPCDFNLLSFVWRDANKTFWTFDKTLQTPSHHLRINKSSFESINTGYRMTVEGNFNLVVKNNSGTQQTISGTYKLAFCYFW